MKSYTIMLVRAVTVGIAATLTLLLLIPHLKPIPIGDWSLSDKRNHVDAFAALGFPSALYTPKDLRAVFPLGAALGFALECIQPLFGRTYALGDFAADAVGLGVGTMFGLGFRLLLAKRSQVRHRRRRDAHVRGA